MKTKKRFEKINKIEMLKVRGGRKVKDLIIR